MRESDPTNHDEMNAIRLATKLLFEPVLFAGFRHSDRISSMNRGRQSRSANIARARELQRIAALSAVERALLALRLGRRARTYMALAGQR
jgi:hypothetical protein